MFKEGDVENVGNGCIRLTTQVKYRHEGSTSQESEPFKLWPNPLSSTVDFSSSQESDINSWIEENMIKALINNYFLHNGAPHFAIQGYSYMYFPPLLTVNFKSNWSCIQHWIWQMQFSHIFHASNPTMSCTPIDLKFVACTGALWENWIEYLDPFYVVPIVNKIYFITKRRLLCALTRFSWF